MRVYFYNLLAAIVILSAIYSCTNETDASKELNLTISLLGTPQCNNQKSAEILGNTSVFQSCIEYSFDQSSKRLSIKHYNACFNCCPESLYCTIIDRNDTIIIQEFEQHMGCKCNCLYDLNLEVNGIESGKYQLRIIEPYAGIQDKLRFELDLLKQKSGTFCVTRSQYPWGE